MELSGSIFIWETHINLTNFKFK